MNESSIPNLPAPAIPSKQMSTYNFMDSSTKHHLSNNTSVINTSGPVTTAVFTLGCKGRGKGEFLNPQDVAIDCFRRIFVTDSINQCIQVFEGTMTHFENAKCVAKIGDRGRTVGQISRPTGITVVPSGLIAVSDYENRVVNLFTACGQYRSRLGVGRLKGPRGLC